MTVSLNTTSTPTPDPTATPSPTPSATALPTETARPTVDVAESDAFAIAAAPVPVETPRPVATGLAEPSTSSLESAAGREGEWIQGLVGVLFVGGAFSMGIVMVLLFVRLRKGRDIFD